LYVPSAGDSTQVRTISTFLTTIINDESNEPSESNEILTSKNHKTMPRALLPPPAHTHA
jgi:hypothetical protein